MTEALADALREAQKMLWMAFRINPTEHQRSQFNNFATNTLGPLLAAYEASKSSPAKPDVVKKALEALRKIEGIVDGDEWILAWGSEGRIRFHTELIERLCFDAIASLEAEGEKGGDLVQQRGLANKTRDTIDSLRAQVAELTRALEQCETVCQRYREAFDRVKVERDRALAQQGEKPQECKHEGWSFEKQGRRCFECGALMMDFGD